MTALSYTRGLWIHQYDQLHEATIAEICATATGYAGASVVLKKLFDGETIMGPAIDHDPLAPASVAAFQAQQAEAAAAHVQLLPWVNATHHDQYALHATAGAVLVVDLEPYPQFWADGAPGDVQTYLRGLRGAGVQQVLVSIDARRSAEVQLVVDSWVGLVDALLPQLYWTDFGQPEPAIVPLLNQVRTYGVEVVPVFPYNAMAGDLLSAWGSALALDATGASLWRMGLANSAQLQAFRALSLPAIPTPQGSTDIADLKRQLGIAQDKLQAIAHVLSM